MLFTWGSAQCEGSEAERGYIQDGGFGVRLCQHSRSYKGVEIIEYVLEQSASNYSEIVEIETI